MNAAKGLWATLALTLTSLALAAPALAAEEEAPAWSVSSLATPTAFVRGDVENDFYDLRIANIGAEVTDGSEITIVDTLPAGVEVLGTPDFSWRILEAGKSLPEEVDLGPTRCTVTPGAQVTVTCTLPSQLPGDEEESARLYPSEELRILIDVVAATGATSEGQVLSNHVEVQGGGAPPASAGFENEVATLDGKGEPLPAKAGFSYYRGILVGADGEQLSQAASHPYQLITSYAVNTNPAPQSAEAHAVPAGGDVKDVRVVLPAGLVGSATAATECSAQQFTTIQHGQIGNATFDLTACPDGSVVGLVSVQDADGGSVMAPTPLYNLVPPPGQAAQFGFQYANLPFFIDTEVRSGSDYGLVSVLRNQSQVKRVTAATVTIWGTPADERHDALRGNCMIPIVPHFHLSGGDCPAGKAPRPLLRLPSSCPTGLQLPMSISSWTAPEQFFTGTSLAPETSGCSKLDFDPSLQARPTTDLADSPAGLDADLHIPQDEDPEDLGTADLRKTVVTLPEGLVINPSSANGLDACAPDQIGLTSDPGVSPPSFTPDPSACTPEARIGTAEVETPLLGHPLKGGVYVAAPHQNPFGSLLAIYIAIDDPQTGIALKLAGEVHADPQTGRLTTTFDETPQQPFEDFKLDFFGGAGAALRTPATCGAYSTDSALTPWSAPESGPPATDSDSYEIAKAPGGGACATSPGALPNSPAFGAGTEAPIARAYSPAVVRLRREDGSQEFSAVSLTPPPGLLARLAGIPYCPEAALAVAAAKSGNAEKADPSCPPASQVGTVTVGAGAGPAPYYTQGKAYLTGPYKGGPIGLAVITPAAAGPYDLGTVVSRVALRIDPETTRITATSDEIPHILQGIPLDVRSIAVRLDHPGWALNPTSCDPMAFTGTETSTLGQAAPLSERFQVGECSALGFKPKLRLRLKGKANRGAHPAFTATLTMPEGGANIARAAVTLPHSEFIDQAHFQTICTRVQFAADACPAGSVYGFAKATSPLLDYAVEGPVYLRSSVHKLPDVVARLRGPANQPIEAVVVGRVDSVKGGLRTTFEAVPDVPLTQVVVSMQGGRKGLFQNSTNICKGVHRATVLFDAQNGKVADSKPKVKAQCGGKGRRQR